MWMPINANCCHDVRSHTSFNDSPAAVVLEWKLTSRKVNLARIPQKLSLINASHPHDNALHTKTICFKVTPDCCAEIYVRLSER